MTNVQVERKLHSLLKDGFMHTCRLVQTRNDRRNPNLTLKVVELRKNYIDSASCCATHSITTSDTVWANVTHVALKYSGLLVLLY
jgi:hypothetical protein